MIDDKISSIMMSNQYKTFQYPNYFYEEIKNFTKFQINSIPENFDHKRKIGENDSIISELIRNDKIEVFIIYVNKNNYSLNSTIESSIFETNLLLLEREPSLIEYSAFYGSIQIFKYLYSNGVNLTPSLWIYGIHGSDPELIHILEERHILPEDDTYQNCLLESIKCFHNNIANYILDNFIDESKIDQLNLMIYSTSFQFHNYFFFPNNLDQNIFYFYACQFDYLNIVEYFVKTKKIDINMKMILKLFNLK